MNITIALHDAWLARPDDLRRALAILAGLEIPPRGEAARPVAEANGHHEYQQEDRRPNGRAREHQASRYPGSDDRAQATDDDDHDQEDQEESPPTSGRQLLGWASKQTPDAKGAVINYGKRSGLKSRVIDWTPDQVNAAYHHVRGVRSSR